MSVKAMLNGFEQTKRMFFIAGIRSAHSAYRRERCTMITLSPPKAVQCREGGAKLKRQMRLSCCQGADFKEKIPGTVTTTTTQFPSSIRESRLSPVFRNQKGF